MNTERNQSKPYQVTPEQVEQHLRRGRQLHDEAVFYYTLRVFRSADAFVHDLYTGLRCLVRQASTGVPRANHGSLPVAPPEKSVPTPPAPSAHP